MRTDTKAMLEECTYNNGCISGVDCEGCAVEVHNHFGDDDLITSHHLTVEVIMMMIQVNSFCTSV